MLYTKLNLLNAEFGAQILCYHAYDQNTTSRIPLRCLLIKEKQNEEKKFSEHHYNIHYPLQYYYNVHSLITTLI